MTKDIKKKIIFASQNQLKMGFNIGSEGNISFRDGSNVFITRSGIEISKMSADDICEVDISGKIKNDMKPSTEIDMHLMLYRKRTDVSAIVHCHSMWASVLSCLRKKIPSFHYMVAEFGGIDIRCSKYATFGTKKLAELVFDATKNRKGCLIANHGQICLGRNVDDAMHLSSALEKLSKQYYFCLASKHIKLLSRDQMKDVVNSFASYKI